MIQLDTELLVPFVVLPFAPESSKQTYRHLYKHRREDVLAYIGELFANMTDTDSVCIRPQKLFDFSLLLGYDTLAVNWYAVVWAD